MAQVLNIPLVLLLLLSANSTTYAGQVSKDIWSEALVNTLPQVECKAGGFFQVCYSWTEKTCNSEIGNLVKLCISRIGKNVPDTMELPGKDQKWTDLTTSCLYEEVKKKFKSYLLEEQHCVDGLKLLK